MDNQPNPNNQPQNEQNILPDTSELSGEDILHSQENNSSRTVPLGALIDERKKFQRQIEEERNLRKQYEDVLTALGREAGGVENNPSIKSEYEEILNTYGEAAANNWLNQQAMNNDLAVVSENQAVIQHLQQKHKDIYSVPEVRQAIDAYLKLDVDPSKSLIEQGFPEAVEYISSIYKAGYNSALRLKDQNNSAKARMGSSITSAVPSDNHEKVFSRKEIASMDADTFAKCEKAIFDQMAKGLIK